jgi:site-specific recombinase XerC
LHTFKVPCNAQIATQSRRLQPEIISSQEGHLRHHHLSRSLHSEKTLFRIGLRREELTKLDVRDIDFERKRIQVRGKGNKVRVMPIINWKVFIWILFSPHQHHLFSLAESSTA